MFPFYRSQSFPECEVFGSGPWSSIDMAYLKKKE